MPQLYVIYRPEDTRKKSAEILDVLKKTYGTSHVKSPDFTNYVDVYQIEHDVQKSDFLLVIIGNYWADLVDETGVNLLNSVYDPVHMAIATAINSRKRLIPVLVDGASMPKRARLPRELRPLATQEPVKLDKNEVLSKSLNKGLKDIIKRDSLIKVPNFVPKVKSPQRPSTPISHNRIQRQSSHYNWQTWIKRGLLPTAALICIAVAMVIINTPDYVDAPVVKTSDPITPVLATIFPTSTATTMMNMNLTPTENLPQTVVDSQPRITVDNASQLALIDDDILGLRQPALVVFSQDKTLFIFMSPELREIQVRDIASGISMKTIDTSPDTPVAIQLSSDETRLHVLLDNGQILTWGVPIDS